MHGNDCYRFCERLMALSRRRKAHPKLLELPGIVPDTDTEDQASLTQAIDIRRLPGQNDWVAIVNAADQRPKPDSLSSRGKGREHIPGIGGSGRMIVRPVRIESELFSQLNEIDAIRQRLRAETNSEPRTGGSRGHPWMDRSVWPGRVMAQKRFLPALIKPSIPTSIHTEDRMFSIRFADVGCGGQSTSGTADVPGGSGAAIARSMNASEARLRGRSECHQSPTSRYRLLFSIGRTSSPSFRTIAATRRFTKPTPCPARTIAARVVG